MSARIAVIGSNCIDVYVDEDGVSAVGGNALNVAVGLARQGRDVEYLGAVGDDESGRRTLAALAREGVHAERVRVLSGMPTARTLIEHGAGRERIFNEQYYEICDDYRPSDDELEGLGARTHVHGAQAPRLVPDLERLASGGMRLSYDFSEQCDDAPVRGLQVAFFSGHGLARTEAEALAAGALRRGARAAVVTLGADGSVGHSAERATYVPAAPAEVRDTCGAGDAYISGFLDAWLRGEGLERSMRAGARAAAAACTVLGAWPQDLRPAEVVR